MDTSLAETLSRGREQTTDTRRAELIRELRHAVAEYEARLTACEAGDAAPTCIGTLGGASSRSGPPRTLSGMTCPGGLILHGDGTVAGCTEDDEPEGCRGRNERHEDHSIRCSVSTLPGCDYCGVHIT